jgi:branched-chain amino acid transport system permease protein
MDLQTAIQTAASAGAASTMLMLIAVGLTLAFGVMQMANLAHGHVFMAGAYTVFVLYALGGVPYWAAVAAAVGVCAGIGLAIERGIFRQVRGDVVAGFIATAGLIFIFEVFMGWRWGWGLMKIIPKPYMIPFNIMGASIDFARIQLIPFAVVAIGGLIFFMRRFKLGRALRAVAQDPEAASLQGISINKITALAMGIAGALAGLAGGLMSTIYAVTPYLGHAVILPALVTVVVGGLGSVEGTIIAAVILGFTQTFVTTLTDGVTALMVLYAVMGIVLAIRPQGLIGRVIA